MRAKDFLAEVIDLNAPRPVPEVVQELEHALRTKELAQDYPPGLFAGWIDTSASRLRSDPVAVAVDIRVVGGLTGDDEDTCQLVENLLLGEMIHAGLINEELAQAERKTGSALAAVHASYISADPVLIRARRTGGRFKGWCHDE